MTTDTKQIIEIYGVVIPTQWDRRGHIVQVAVQTDELENYLVDEEHNNALLQKIDKKIQIYGTIIGEDIQGRKIIKIINN